MSDPITEDENSQREAELAHTDDQNDEMPKLVDPADLDEAEVKPTQESEPAPVPAPESLPVPVMQTGSAPIEATEPTTTTTAIVPPSASVTTIPTPETVVITTPEPAVSATDDTKHDAELAIVSSTDSKPIETVQTEAVDSTNSQQPQSTSQSAERARTSWISNRRSASFRYGDDYVPEVISFPQPAPTTEQSTPVRPLKRTHSFVRLSMTDGTARVITDADKTPSPPHHKSSPATFARAAAGLRRSYSATGLNERLAAAAAASGDERSPKIPRIASNIGRSRDSRAWEFWCDNEVRQNRSLTARADQEQSGSAADAIGVLRANRRALTQNNARQNANVLARVTSRMSDEHGIKKSRGPIQRASTSAGRLQAKGKKKKDSSESDDLPQTESDKENWEPGVEKARRQRPHATPMNSQRQRQILGENTEIMSQNSSLGAMLAREKGGNGQSGHADPEQDDELKVFMSGGGMSGRTSLSSAEEAGCVEGLLKLSQGNWR